MKAGVLITARLGSTRLKSKHLLPVDGQPIISFLIRRIVEEFQEEMSQGKAAVIIATTLEPENREFERLAGEGVEVHYGSKENIPLRHLQAADTLGLEIIVSVDGDDVLCSVKGMRAVYDALRGGAKYVRTANLPFGMNSLGYSRAFLAGSLQDHHGDTLETGWGRIFDATCVTDLALPFPVQDNALRFTLDYDEDYQFFSAVLKEMGKAVFTASDEEIVRLVLDKKLYLLNEAISKTYWENFYRIQEEERLKSALKNDHTQPKGQD
jgi:spore coat polysaccharide biosynthesis protein SpsF